MTEEMSYIQQHMSGPAEPVRPWPDHFPQLDGTCDSCKTGVKKSRGT